MDQDRKILIAAFAPESEHEELPQTLARVGAWISEQPLLTTFSLTVDSSGGGLSLQVRAVAQAGNPKNIQMGVVRNDPTAGVHPEHNDQIATWISGHSMGGQADVHAVTLRLGSNERATTYTILWAIQPIDTD